MSEGGSRIATDGELEDGVAGGSLRVADAVRDDIIASHIPAFHPDDVTVMRRFAAELRTHEGIIR